MVSLPAALGVLAQESIPLPGNWQDVLLGNLGLTAYLLWDSAEKRREIRAIREEARRDRDTLEAEAREMSKKALAALDALASREGAR